MLRRALVKSGLTSFAGVILHKLLFSPPANGQAVSVASPSGQPMTLKKTKVVRTRPEDAFAFFSDPEQCALYIPNCTAIRNVTKPMRVGATWEYEYAMAGNTFTGNSRCTQYEPSKSFAVRSEGGFASDWLYTFESAGPNSTRVTVTVNYDPPSRLLAKVARKSLLKMHDAGADHALEQATTLIEDRGA